MKANSAKIKAIHICAVHLFPHHGPTLIFREKTTKTDAQVQVSPVYWSPAGTYQKGTFIADKIFNDSSPCLFPGMVCNEGSLYDWLWMKANKYI